MNNVKHRRYVWTEPWASVNDRLLGLPDPEDESTTILRGADNYYQLPQSNMSEEWNLLPVLAKTNYINITKIYNITHSLKNVTYIIIIINNTRSNRVKNRTSSPLTTNYNKTFCLKYQMLHVHARTHMHIVLFVVLVPRPPGFYNSQREVASTLLGWLLPDHTLPSADAHWLPTNRLPSHAGADCCTKWWSMIWTEDWNLG